MSGPLPRFLMIESEAPQDRAARRASVGKSAGESFAATLQQMARCHVDLFAPADEDAATMGLDDIARYDAVFFGGAPHHVYEKTPAVRRQLAFMELVFASGTPGFGSCAGLQLAVAAAGGTVRAIPAGREAGLARAIAPTPAGLSHPLLAGRDALWDAGAIHGDEVADLPEGATLLASNASVRVQAAQIQHLRGIFWGVQYHPELSPGEIGAALRRDAEALIRDRLAADHKDVEAMASLFDRLERDPNDAPARWRLGTTEQYANEAGRRTELRNFLANLAALDRRPPASDAIRILQERMAAAANSLDFEEARRCRDQINLIRGGAAADDAARADTSGLQRQRPGAMGLGTSQQQVTPPPGWRPPARPDLMTHRKGRNETR